MKPTFSWMISAGAAFAVAGCASPKPAPQTLDGQAVFSALQHAVVAAGKKAEPSLALVTVENPNRPPPTGRSVGSMNLSELAASLPTTGMIVTTNGHILAPGVIKPDQDNRITVLVGETEYVARAVKTDDALGMTILKLDTDDTFTPLDLSAVADLAAGEWALILKPSDEDSDFQKLSTLAVCQGERAGRYRRYLLNQSLLSSSGALVVNLSGQNVGLVDRGAVLALTDLREDVDRLIADATGAKTAGDDAQKKGWFGALAQPINKEYAKVRELPTSALQVLYAAAGSPAAAAGLRAGDLIVGLNGKPLRLTGARLMDYFAKTLNPRAGAKFTLSVLRDGKTLELPGTFAKAPTPETLRAEDLGVSVAGITDYDVALQNLATDRGVLVTDVLRGSPAASSGTLRQTLLARRDIILELAGKPTPTLEAFSQALEAIRREHPPVVLVKYQRGLMTGYAGLNLALGEQDKETKP